MERERERDKMSGSQCPVSDGKQRDTVGSLFQSQNDVARSFIFSSEFTRTINVAVVLPGFFHGRVFCVSLSRVIKTAV